MANASFEPFKLKAQLENLTKAPTLENANIMLCQIKAIKLKNFQLVQDVFLTTLLTLMDDAKGLKKDEIKTVLIQCVNLILKDSRIKHELPYRTVLVIILHQIFDFNANSYIATPSEEFKISVFNCFSIASSHLDYGAVEKFMVEDNKILLSQCIFVCKEAILKEKYSKLRQTAVEALMSLMQLHDKSDFNDIVLRDQMSNILFLVLPQISAVLIKTCLEETIKESSLVQISTKAFGRFLCLVFEDYTKSSTDIKNQDFLQLVTLVIPESEDRLLEEKSSPKVDPTKLKKSNRWIQDAAKRISPAIQRLKSLRGSEHQKIRFELATLSWNLLQRCLPNIQNFAPFLLENLIMFADDSDDKIKVFSQSSLKELSATLVLDQEIEELFTTHLIIMPRILITGDESEQIAAFTLLNSFIMTITADGSSFTQLLQIQAILDKFINLMVKSSEIDFNNDLFFENLSSGSLEDKFYNMKMPWKKFKNLKNESIAQKFQEICYNIGKSSSAQICVNYLLDNLNSIEYLVLLIEILKTGDNLSLSQDQIEAIIEEFSSETYWTMRTEAINRIEKKPKATHEEWFKHNTPGLYESAIEVRLRGIDLNQEDDKVNEMNLKMIKYNILSTCFVVELIATTSKIMGKKFQRFILRILHRVLEKAGSSNFLIQSAGIYAMDSISSAMGFSEISQLIDSNSDFLLFNINKMIRRNQSNEAVLDMLSVIFRFSKTSMTSYIKDIVETSSEYLTGDKLMKNTLSYLKLFRLYAGCIRQWENYCVVDTTEDNFEQNWNEFLEHCLYELKDHPLESNETIPIEECSNKDEQPYENSEPLPDDLEETKEEIPDHIQLIVKVLSSSLQFFASSNQSEVLLTHQIFIDSFSTLHYYENQFLPMVHQMWYPFTKQFQGLNLLILQHSFQLLLLTAKFAKSFVNKKSTDDVIPVLNQFLLKSRKSKDSTANLTYTQEFKLLREILNEYGSLAIYLDLEDRDLDCIIDILLLYKNSTNESLVSASSRSLEIIRNYNPALIHLKLLSLK